MDDIQHLASSKGYSILVVAISDRISFTILRPIANVN